MNIGVSNLGGGFDNLASNPLKTQNRKMQLAVPRGLEPPTFGLGNRCSIRLSYGTNGKICALGFLKMLAFVQCMP